MKTSTIIKVKSISELIKKNHSPFGGFYFNNKIMINLPLAKPYVGQPCNGCGLCCHIQLCNTGAFLLKKSPTFGEKTIKGKCPALLSKPEGRFTCGLIESPERFIKSTYRPEIISKTVATLVGSGTGCDELGFSEDAMEEFIMDEIMEKLKNNPIWVMEIRAAHALLHKF